MRKIRSVLNRVGIGRAIALVLLFNLLLLRIWDPAPIEALRHRGFDLYQSIQPRAVTARPVVIVDIDEPSLRELGQWPWPRTIVAAMIDRITSLGAVAVGFDVIFAEPDRVSPGVAAASFAGLDEATRAKLLSLPSNDAILADALRRGRVVVG
ncbi:MAG TPA: CHASE2 domain-containing protein, partial [Vitreimonas sp.]|nr:CHASE2 domain-containing protein [Vitreimonas sp.]